MTNNYGKIIKANLEKRFADPAKDFAEKLSASEKHGQFAFMAFGEACMLSREGIFLDQKAENGARGIIISLYALGASAQPKVLTPFKSFKDFPNSMPYAGAFVTHTEQILVPYVEAVKNHLPLIQKTLNGHAAGQDVSGDCAFVVYPLPKVALCYLLYDADEDFPASVTCLYAHNANQFLPIDALADVGEYTSKKILALVSAGE